MTLIAMSAIVTIAVRSVGMLSLSGNTGARPAPYPPRPAASAVGREQAPLHVGHEVARDPLGIDLALEGEPVGQRERHDRPALGPERAVGRGHLRQALAQAPVARGEL